jgi:hypothetical protein
MPSTSQGFYTGSTRRHFSRPNTLKYNRKNPAVNYGIVEVVGSIPSGSTIITPWETRGFCFGSYIPD